MNFILPRPALLLSLCGAALLGSIRAQDEPQKPAEPAPAGKERAFFGVHVRPLPEEVRAQLDIPDGQGLLVDGLDTLSPAAASGIRIYDVLTHFNDQILLTPDQFVALVHGSKPGDEVEVTWLRRGKETKGKLTLQSAKPINESTISGEFKVDVPLDFQALKERLQNSIRDQPEMQEMLEKIFEHQQHSLPKALIEKASCVRHADNQGVVELTRNNGDTTVRITDAQNQLLFEGPLNTPEDRANIPENLRPRLELVESMIQPGK